MTERPSPAHVSRVIEQLSSFTDEQLDETIAASDDDPTAGGQWPRQVGWQIGDAARAEVEQRRRRRGAPVPLDQYAAEVRKATTEGLTRRADFLAEQLRRVRGGTGGAAYRHLTRQSEIVDEEMTRRLAALADRHDIPADHVHPWNAPAPPSALDDVVARAAAARDRAAAGVPQPGVPELDLLEHEPERTVPVWLIACIAAVLAVWLVVALIISS